MRKLLVICFSVAALGVVLTGCLGPRVEEADVRSAVEAVMNVNIDLGDAVTAGLIGDGSVFQYAANDGTYVVEIDFSDSPTVNTSAAYHAYTLPGTDIVVTGTLSSSADSSASPVSGSTSGTLEVSGASFGVLEYDLLTVGVTDAGVWQSATVTGTVVADGEEFDVVDWGLGSLHIANSNALFAYLQAAMGF